MAWNKEKIENTLNALHRRILTVKEGPLLTSLKYDYKTLLYAIKDIDSKMYDYYMRLPLPVQSEYVEYNDFEIESATAFLDNVPKLDRIQRIIEEKKLSTISPLFLKKIPLDVQVEMTREFFSSFDQDHYTLLEKLLKDNIYFARKKSEIPDALGKCYFLNSLQESFIIVDVKGRKKVTTLSHELAHAFEFNLIPNFYHQMNWHFSSFVECYPRFIELMFIDYFIDGEYKMLLTDIKRDLFDCLKLVVENYYSVIYNIKEYKPRTHQMFVENGKGYYKKSIDYIISDLLAIYMLNLYKNNRDEYEKFIVDYHSFKGVSDKAIWSLFESSDLETAFLEEYSVLIRNLRAMKK